MALMISVWMAIVAGVLRRLLDIFVQAILARSI
jgi:hypothetical protein